MKYHKHHFSFLVFSFSLISLFTVVAQQPKLDSLYSVWQDESQSDSNRVAAYNKYIFDGYLFSRSDTAEILADALHAYATQHNYPKAAATAYNLQGLANWFQSNYPGALELTQKSLEINEEIGDKKGIAGNLNGFGNIYLYMGNYIRALEYYQKSLVIQEEIGYKSGIASNLASIGIMYDYQGNYTRALEYYQRGLVIQEEIGNKKDIAGSLNNIGNIYDSQGNYPRALEYHHKSLAMQEEIGNKNGIANSLGNIGNIYQKQGDTHRALEYFQKSLALKEEIGNKKDIAISLNNIGSLYLKQGKLALSIDNCQKGLALAKEISALEYQKDACQCLYDTYKAMGKSAKALEYYEQMIVVRDSIYNEENTKKLVQIDMQYEFDRKEAAVKAEQEKKDAITKQELQRQKLVRNGFVGGFAVVLLFAGVFFRQRNKIGKEKERSEELLLNILPEEVADELKDKGHSDAQLIEQVTVLFTDFKGFTELSEKVTPKELVADLHECFSAFDNICEKYGIEKIKTIGDAYMAAGGLPTPNTTHAKDVINAAFEMRDFIAEGKVQKLAVGLPYFEIRIGIHTGHVVAGIVGVKKFQYDIWGDTVNTASRIESKGEAGKVNISKTTYNLLKDEPDLAFISRGSIEVKGKGAIEMYFVESKSASL